MPTLPPFELPNTSRAVFALGVFDGVHLGHQAVIEELLITAKKYNAEPVVIYFSPFPVNVLRPELNIPALTTLEQKEAIIASYGIRHIVRYPFSLELAALSPEAFVRDFFTNQPYQTCAICIGENWRFGSGNSGDVDCLKTIAADFNIEVRDVPPKLWDNERISSTRIRQAIAGGKIQDAIAMLGHPLVIEGTVEHGQNIARQNLHCPTINLTSPQLQITKFGVYATKIKFAESGTIYPGIAYIGDAPTIRHDGKIICEVHLFGFTGNAYGSQVNVELLDFMRPSIKFDSAAALKQQIDQDIRQLKQIIS